MKTEKFALVGTFPTPFGTCLGHFVRATHVHESAEDAKPRRVCWSHPRKSLKLNTAKSDSLKSANQNQHSMKHF